MKLFEHPDFEPDFSQTSRIDYAQLRWPLTLAMA